MSARFMFCVNGDRGEPTGRIERVELLTGDPFGSALTIDAGVWPPSDCPRFSRLPDGVRISRRKFRILGYRTWVGNWCWDAASLPAQTGADLLNYLRKLGWQVEAGECRLFDMWRRGEIFRASDVDAASMTAVELEARKKARA